MPHSLATLGVSAPRSGWFVFLVFFILFYFLKQSSMRFVFGPQPWLHGLTARAGAMVSIG